MGPVASSSVHAWTGWAREMLEAVRVAPATTGIPPAEVLDAVGSYLDVWADAAGSHGEGPFRWRADVPADELVYLTNSLYNLDVWVTATAGRNPGNPEPIEGHLFHVVLVEALLFALTEQGPSEAAFAGQLRPWWPVVSDPQAERHHAPAAGAGDGATVAEVARS